MADLSTIDKQVLEGLFQMKGGYVLDFSDRTMEAFFKNDIGVNIYAEKYNYSTGSKANRIRGFWIEADNVIVGKSILKLIEYIESKITIGDFKQTDFTDIKLQAGQKIGNKLLDKEIEELEINTDIKFSEEIGKYLKKAEDEIKKTDYDGSIGTLSTFLEEFFEGLHIKLTGQSLGESADFKKDFSKIKKLLNLAPDGYTDERIKQILSGLSGIVEAMDRLCNTMGDRHRKLKDEEGKVRVKPLKHHAILMLNSVKTLTRFLFDSYVYQTERKEDLEKKLINILKSDSTQKELVPANKVGNRLSNRSFEDIHKNKFIKKRLSKSDKFINLYLIKKYIEQYDISSRDENSEFFGVMEVLYNDITIDDITNIYNKYVLSKNDQAIYLKPFINDLIQNKKSIISSDIQKEIDILNLTECNTFYCLYNTLVHQFSRDTHKEECIKEALKLKIAIKGKEKELIDIIKKYFTGWTIDKIDYTDQIIMFINNNEIRTFPLPKTIELVNNVLSITNKFHGDCLVQIGNKKFKISFEGIKELEKLFNK